MESVCTGWQDVCLGKVLGVRREMISMALHPTLLLPPPPLGSKRPKEILQLPESRVSKSQASKYSETHQGKYTSSRGPGPRGITEGQGEAELWFFNDSEKIQEGWAEPGR